MSKRTETDLTVEYEDKGIKINHHLLDKQDCWDNLDNIKDLHAARLRLEVVMEITDDPVVLRKCDEVYTAIEFALQGQWGFPLDKNFHRFWKRPKCRCPRFDNEERYGTKWAITQEDCPLHGWKDEETNAPKKDS